MFLVEKKILGLLSYFVEDKSVFLYSLFNLTVWDHKILIHPGLNAHLEECATLLWKVIIPYFSFSFWIFQVIGHCGDGKWSSQCKGPYYNIFSWFRGDSQALIWPDVSNQITSNFMWPLRRIQDPLLSIISNYVEGICQLMHSQEKLLPII